MNEFFYIRVVLHNADSQQYADLAKQLSNVGISDQMTICGLIRTLPPGEYWQPKLSSAKLGIIGGIQGLGSDTLTVVLNVQKIATKISSNPTVVVIQGNDIQGLGF